jgi:hypothetical protein
MSFELTKQLALKGYDYENTKIYGRLALGIIGRQSMFKKLLEVRKDDLAWIHSRERA